MSARAASLLLLVPVLLAALTAAPESAAVPQEDRPMIIVDTDFAFYGDDADSLLLLLRSPGIEIVGVTTTSGNVWTEQATANVLRVLEDAGRSDIPVHPGLPSQTHQHRLRYYWEVERERWAKSAYGGALALGREIPPPEAPPGGWAKARAASKPAPEFIVETVLAHPGKITILEIGPPDNLVAAIRQEPKVVSLVKHVYVFGGALQAPGNTTASAEFNFWFDPESSEAMLESGLPLTLLPLDATHDEAFGAPLQERLARATNPFGRHVHETVTRRLQSHPGLPVPLWDEVLTAILIKPSLVKESKQQAVEVVRERGPEYGRSRLRKREGSRTPTVNVVYRVDDAALQRLLGDLLSD
jgi:inosine-uridine nucleoside N-ribohydrolase